MALFPALLFPTRRSLIPKPLPSLGSMGMRAHWMATATLHGQKQTYTTHISTTVLPVPGPWGVRMGCPPRRPSSGLPGGSGDTSHILQTPLKCSLAQPALLLRSSCLQNRHCTSFVQGETSSLPARLFWLPGHAWTAFLPSKKPSSQHKTSHISLPCLSSLVPSCCLAGASAKARVPPCSRRARPFSWCLSASAQNEAGQGLVLPTAARLGPGLRLLPGRAGGELGGGRDHVPLETLRAAGNCSCAERQPQWRWQPQWQWQRLWQSPRAAAGAARRPFAAPASPHGTRLWGVEMLPVLWEDGP